MLHHVVIFLVLFFKFSPVEIVSWSLAQRASCSTFVIHDLIFDYLDTVVSNDKKMQYHQNLVQR